ncbi:MAG: flagellar basal body L-ring protein FlgH [Bryobacterales bacterium]
MRNKTVLAIAQILAGCIVFALPAGAKGKEKKPPELSPLEQYLEQARRGSTDPNAAAAPGSTWSPNARLFDVATDLRASRVNDIVTIIVQERASAVSQGSVSSERSSSANASIGALAGIPSPVGGLQNLLGVDSEKTLEGTGETSRRTVLTATMAARVVEVLPNGNLVIEGEKSVGVNSEVQVIKLRGVVRPYDVSVANAISSEQIAQLELKVNGKGVVGDAIRRPNFLYRFILGILPF